MREVPGNATATQDAHTFLLKGTELYQCYQKCDYDQAIDWMKHSRGNVP